MTEENANNSDVKKAFEAIKSKQNHHRTAFQYYDGDHPLVFANERLESVFKGVQIKFTENWCSVVVDSVKERIELAGFQVPSGVEALMNDIWEDNQLSIESDDLHEAALVTGEAFLIIWPDDDGRVQAYYNDPRLCHTEYESGNPRQPRMAAKMWVDEGGHYRMTLYYPDRLEYYITDAKAADVTSYGSFRVNTDEGVEGVAVNEYGQIPVFHFRLGNRGYKGDLKDVIPIQNGVNKLLTDMMVAAEYGAFQQRWIISNADMGKLKNAPNEIWNIPAGDGVGQQTSVGAFPPTPLENFLKAIEHLAHDISRISRTPKHYFYSSGGNPSGEALIAMEAPLNKKSKDRIERFDPVWKQAMAFALSISGQQVDPKEIIPIWDVVATVQPRTQAEIRLYGVQAGIPLITILRREGWSDEEIDQLIQDKEAMQKILGDSLLGQFEKGQGID